MSGVLVGMIAFGTVTLRSSLTVSRGSAALGGVRAECGEAIPDLPHLLTLPRRRFSFAFTDRD
ncbi:hypothetical protein GCM10010392_62630 [Streptomyces clavifer]|nr:hypothetical protein GCM10010392_62630 [Streptomyces clavifer]